MLNLYKGIDKFGGVFPYKQSGEEHKRVASVGRIGLKNGGDLESKENIIAFETYVHTTGYET